MDVLAEGRHRRELADKVQVSGAQCVEGTAVVNRQVLFIDLSHILGQDRGNNPLSRGCPLSTNLSQPPLEMTHHSRRSLSPHLSHNLLRDRSH